MLALILRGLNIILVDGDQWLSCRHCTKKGGNPIRFSTGHGIKNHFRHSRHEPEPGVQAEHTSSALVDA